MPLDSGTSLGPFQIDAPLGAGGMGEVYKARDTRLDRTVAIKVLPEHVAAGPDLKQRFEREAKTISSLNHPHICTLHDSGRHSRAWAANQFEKGEDGGSVHGEDWLAGGTSAKAPNAHRPPIETTRLVITILGRAGTPLCVEPRRCRRGSRPCSSTAPLTCETSSPGTRAARDDRDSCGLRYRRSRPD